MVVQGRSHDGGSNHAARGLGQRAPDFLRIGKRAFYEQAELPLADAYANAAGVMVENMLHRDAVEGIGAFVEKRAPRWQG